VRWDDPRRSDLAIRAVTAVAHSTS
jgi:hypothetical protein